MDPAAANFALSGRTEAFHELHEHKMIFYHHLCAVESFEGFLDGSLVLPLELNQYSDHSERVGRRRVYWCEAGSELGSCLCCQQLQWKWDLNKSNHPENTHLHRAASPVNIVLKWFMWIWKQENTTVQWQDFINPLQYSSINMSGC